MNYLLYPLCDAVDTPSNRRSLPQFSICFILSLLFVFMVIDVASAEWSSSATENLPLCTAQNEQHFPALVTDGQGGAIVAWSDARHANRDIFAQRISATGDVQWQTDGIPICDLPSSQSWPLIVNDSKGGPSSFGGIPVTGIRIATHSASTVTETKCGIRRYTRLYPSYIAR